MKKKCVALVFGGRSAEHEVSVNSARNIAAALDKNKFDLAIMGVSKKGSWYLLETIDQRPAIIDEEMKAQNIPTLGFKIELGKGQFIKNESQEILNIDIVFPILHGTFGEDGCVQGFLKMLNMPFVGCGVLSSAAGMDKDIMKQIFTHAGLPNTPYKLLRPWQISPYQELVQQLGSPFFIKPANAGSSVGVHKIKSEAEFSVKLQDAFQYDTKVLAEKFIQGREVEISVLGLTSEPKVSLPGEIRVAHEFYSYEAKYIDQKGADIVIPASLTEATQKQIQQLAQQAYSAINATGFARIDFFVQATGEIYLNEINTLPGFTNISMYPKMWEASGLKYSDLITQLIELGFQQYQLDQTLKT